MLEGSRAAAPALHCAAGKSPGRGAGPRPGRAQPQPRLLPMCPAPPGACRPRAGGASEEPAWRAPPAPAQARARTASRAGRPRPASTRAPAPGTSDWPSAGPAGVGGGCGQAGPSCLRRGRLPRSRCHRRAPASCLLPGSRCGCGSDGRAPAARHLRSGAPTDPRPCLAARSSLIHAPRCCGRCPRRPEARWPPSMTPATDLLQPGHPL